MIELIAIDTIRIGEKVYRKGDSFSIDEARAKRLIEGGHAEEVRTAPTCGEDFELEKMTKSELIEFAKEKGLDATGTKAELIERIAKKIEEETRA